MYSLQNNQKKLLTNLNAIFLTLFVLVLIIFKSTSEAVVPSFFTGWDVLLPVSIYLGQRRNLWEGLVILLLHGHLYSLNSSAPIGMFVVYYLVFTVCHFVVKRKYCFDCLLFAMVCFVCH